MFTKLNGNESYDHIFGSSFDCYLENTTYQELVQALGPPSLPEKSGDGKIQKEWVFVDEDGNPFTIYDWKTGSEDVTMNEITTWCVGAKTDTTSFKEWLTSKFNSL